MSTRRRDGANPSEYWLTSQPPPSDWFVNTDARKEFETELAERWLRRQAEKQEGFGAGDFALAISAVAFLISLALLLDLLFKG